MYIVEKVREKGRVKMLIPKRQVLTNLIKMRIINILNQT